MQLSNVQPDDLSSGASDAEILAANPTVVFLDSKSGLCPKGDDPLTTNQADRALLLRTTAEEGLISGELTVTFNGESTTLDANAHRTGDRECASALQALPNIDRVACTRGAVSEYGGADYLVSLLR